MLCQAKIFEQKWNVEFIYLDNYICIKPHICLNNEAIAGSAACGIDLRIIENKAEIPRCFQW